jgi:4-amino-4-deoxy-L-arabinose transferase-like glycosyltransferase
LSRPKHDYYTGQLFMEQFFRNIIDKYRIAIEKISAKLNSLSRPALLLLLLAIAAVLLLVTSQFIEKSGDAVYKWGILRYYADSGIWYPVHADHHQGRWALNLPVLLIMKLFGSSAWVYYVFPFATGMVGALFIYAVTSRLCSRIAGIAAFLIFFIFPLSARGDTQFLPMLPAAMFILIALYCVLRWFDSKNLLNIILAGLMIILAYGCKVTSLYWALAIVLAIGLYSPETRVWFKILRLKIGTAFIVFSATIVAGLLIETLVINHLCGFSYGRLQLIAGSHLSAQIGTEEEYHGFFAWLFSFLRPLSLRGKYFESMPCFFIFILGLISAALALWKGSARKKFTAFCLILVYLLHCYMVCKVFPFLYPEQALSRYFMPVALVCIVLYCSTSLEWENFVWNRLRNLQIRSLAKFVLCLLWLIPSLIYVANSWLRNGTIINTFQGERLFAEAESKKLPVMLKLKKAPANSQLCSADRKSALRWMTLFGPVELIPELSTGSFQGSRQYLILMNSAALPTAEKALVINELKINFRPHSPQSEGPENYSPIALSSSGSYTDD